MGKVSARIAELQAIHGEKHGITIDSITTELEEARKLAKSQGQAGAMVSASMSKAKLHGIILDKKEIKNLKQGYYCEKCQDYRCTCN